MCKRNVRSLGRLLAGMMCVVGLTMATGCSQKCCGKGDCKQSTKCPANCDKPCSKKAASTTTTKCPANCDKPCCKKA